MFLKEMKIVDQSVIFANGLVIRKMVVKYSFLRGYFVGVFVGKKIHRLNYRWIRNPQQKNSSTTNFQWRVYQWFRKYNLILDRIFYRWKTILWKKFIIKIILYFIYFFLSRYLNTIIYLSSIFVLMKHNHIKNTIHIST